MTSLRNPSGAGADIGNSPPAVQSNLTASNVQTAPGPHFAAVKQDNIRRPSTDIQVHNYSPIFLRKLPGSASLPGNHGFQIRPGRRYDKITGKTAQQFQHHARIFLAR